MTHFSDLGLHPSILRAVTDAGYETPTPIQAQAIPHLIEGRDLLGVAQTGTGKTAAFTLPTLTRLLETPKPREPKCPRVLVLAPTRELALQIAESFETYAKHMKLVVQTVFGGVKIGGQIRALKAGVDVVVATPGRLVDLMGQGAIDLGRVEHFVLDEADQMLDLGFVRDLRRIAAKVPAKRQTLLFSATMPKPIAELAKDFLRDPVRVSVAPESTTAERVAQGVVHVRQGDKPELLRRLLLEEGIDRVLVFTRTKHGADKVVKSLARSDVEAKAIHGNKSQPQRVKALDAFREGTCRVLVATDIAARGIDVEGVSHVINYEMPNVPEQYVHRIGRTARAGREGFALSLVDPEELYYLRDAERVTRQEISVLDVPPGCEELALPAPDRGFKPVKPKGPQQQQRPPRRQRGEGRKPAGSTAKPKSRQRRRSSARG